MRIIGNFFRKKRAMLKPIAVLAVLGLVGFGGFKVWAETRVGDFANNIKTTLSILDRDNGTEKVNFLSGEMMTFSSRVEVTSDGNAISYPGAYMLIKVPKEYADSKPTFIFTDAVSNKVDRDTDSHYVVRLNYNNLIAGSINSINTQYRLKNTETPEGYRPEIVHELYSADGTLLSRQSKSANTTKQTPSLYTSKIKEGEYYSHYIAKYSDGTNTSIDKGSYETLGIMKFNISGGESYPNNSSNGKKEVVKRHLEYNIPEYMVLTQESIDDGWVFNPVTKTARKTLYGDSQSATITLSYTRNTDDSILGKQVEHKHKFTTEFKDGSVIEKESSYNVGVWARRITDQGRVALIKSPHNPHNATRWHQARNIININKIYDAEKSPGNSWNVVVRVDNEGDPTRIPISTIIDYIPENTKVSRISAYSGNLNKLFDDNKDLRIEVVLYKADGSKVSMGFIEKGKPAQVSVPDTVKDIELYRKIEFKFPEGYTLPAYFTGMDSYKLDFLIGLNYINKKEFADSIPFNSTPVEEVNEAEFNVGGVTKRVSASKYYEKIANKVTNNITANPYKATYTIHDTILINHLRAAQYDGGTLNVDDFKNPKSLILYDAGFDLSSFTKDAIKEGRLIHVDNYNNSGKNALIRLDHKLDLDGFTFGGVSTQRLFSVSEITPNGEHQFELVTYWDEDDENYIGTEGLDNLDFNGDGRESRNVARSTAKIIVLKPEQVAIKKYVRAPGSDFSTSVDKLDAGQAIDYRISVINTSDQPLLSSRVLEVLPKIGDKNIVEGNNGVQENRGSTTGVKMTGPVAPRDGFTISYSTDEPGASQTESWGKNFVSADRITDWSAVRMVKIVQNQGYQVSPQEIVHFIINAKIDESSTDNSVANNTAAVAISATGNLVETDPVRAAVNFPIKIQGVAFMDNNGNSLFERDTDTILPNYKVEILRNSTVVAELKTNDRGEYSYLTKDWGANFSVRFTRPAGLDPQAVLVPVRSSSNTKVNGSTPTAETGGVATTSNVSLSSTSNKVQDRNIGLYVPKGSVKVEHKYLFITPDGVLFPMLKSSEVAVENTNVNSGYDVRDKKKTEITDNNGLVYRFQSATGDPEVGRIKEGESVVTFLYEPKLGGLVKARFVNEQDEELKPEVVVKGNQTQVGTPYTSTKENELTKNNLVYTFKQLKANSAPENGRVTENEQIITYVYAPKQGGSVRARFVNEQNEELLTEVEIKPRGTQVGIEYASTKQNELQKNGLTYIFKELKNDSAPENGRVKAEDQVVTYVYAPKLGGSVIAKFVNQDGVSIQPDETIKAQQTQIGTRYTSNYPNEITANDGITYVFEKIVDGSAPREGQVNGDAQVITYRYVPKKGGAVTAEFVTKTGEKLKTDEVIKAADTPVGTQYTSTKENELTKNNLVYTFESLKQGSAPENSKVKAEAQTVTYVYVPKLGGKVDAKFLDEKGREIKPLENVSPDKTQVGTSYSSTPSTEITFENIVYVYKGLGQNSAPQNGRVSEGAQTISYIYTPKRGGSVIVNFVNEDGESIKDTQILKADGTPVGTAYEAQEDAEIEKDNLVYIFKELKDGSKPKTGRVSEDSTEVTFVYAPKPGGKVVAKFTTADGIELQDEEEVSPQDTQVGTEYASTKPGEIKKGGLVYIFKELKEDSAPEEGRVTVDTQTVNYIYEPKLGDAVSMRFIDTNGVLLGKIEEILPKGKQVGTPYEAKIPETITIDGKTYRLKIVRSDDGDAGEKGEVSENPQMITVIFEFVPPVKTPNTGFNKSEDSFNPIIVIAGFAILAGASVAVVAKQKSSKK